MKKPHKWVMVNDTFIALDKMGVAIGYIAHVKSTFKPPDRLIETS